MMDSGWRWFRGLRQWQRLLLAGGLAIAASGIALLPELLFVLPHGVRWVLAEAAVTAMLLAVGWRIWTVRPGDRWPVCDRPAKPGLLSAVFLHGGLLLLLLPLFQNLGNLGAGDWDLACQWEEAVRQSILTWGQFPWWNPWVRGGFPLAGEPQVGVVSPTTPLVLAFGTPAGMRLSVVLHLLLAAEGMRRLARLWFDGPWPAAFTAFVFVGNGCMLAYTSSNPHIPLSYPYLPWMAYYCFRLDKRIADGIWLGVWASLCLLGVIQYLTAYGAVIAAIVWLRGVRVQQGEQRRRRLVHSLAAAGVVLTLVGWRLAVTGQVLDDFPRELQTLWDVSPFAWLANLFHRPVDVPLDIPTIECNTYVGPFVVLLVLLSLRWGWRWWHWAVVGGLALSLGAYRWYHVSYWLSYWPGFSTMHVVTRWRLISLFGIALAAGSSLDQVRSSGSGRWLMKGALYLLLGCVVADYGHFALKVLPKAFSIPARAEFFPNSVLGDIAATASSASIVNIERWEWPPGALVPGDQTLGYACTLTGYGVIRGNEPQMGYDRGGETARLWVGHPQYIAEHWTDDDVPIEPEYWSPNHIRLRVAPNQKVWINQNPGSWWLVNGQRPFADWRCAEWTQPFVVHADDNGIVDLRIQPPGLKLGLVLTLTGVVLLAVTVRWGLKRSD